MSENEDFNFKIGGVVLWCSVIQVFSGRGSEANGAYVKAALTSLEDVKTLNGYHKSKKAVSVEGGLFNILNLSKVYVVGLKVCDSFYSPRVIELYLDDVRG
jgi:hypothetical protein